MDLVMASQVKLVDDIDNVFHVSVGANVFATPCGAPEVLGCQPNSAPWVVGGMFSPVSVSKLFVALG